MSKATKESPITHPVDELFADRVRHDETFRRILFARAAEEILLGDFDMAKLTLRTYIKGTVGFEGLGRAIDKKPESLKRMFSVKGNPTLANLMLVLRHLQDAEGVAFAVETKDASEIDCEDRRLIVDRKDDLIPA